MKVNSNKKKKKELIRKKKLLLNREERIKEKEEYYKEKDKKVNEIKDKNIKKEVVRVYNPSLIFSNIVEDIKKDYSKDIKDSKPKKITKRTYKSEYLNSYEWKIKCIEVKKYKGGLCQSCGSRKYINIHHGTYKRMGNELAEDLFVLCKYCHQDLHNKYKAIYGKDYEYLFPFTIDYIEKMSGKTIEVKKINSSEVRIEQISGGTNHSVIGTTLYENKERTKVIKSFKIKGIVKKNSSL